MRPVTEEDVARCLFEDPEQAFGYSDGYPYGHEKYDSVIYVDGFIDCKSMADFINRRIGGKE